MGGAEEAYGISESDEEEEDLDWEQGTVVSEETLFDFDSGWSVNAIPDRAPRLPSAGGKNGRASLQVSLHGSTVHACHRAC